MEVILQLIGNLLQRVAEIDLPFDFIACLLAQ
jgi:hypothetical protein